MTFDDLRPDFVTAMRQPFQQIKDMGGTVYLSAEARKRGDGYLPTGIRVVGVTFSEAMNVLEDALAPYDTDEQPLPLLMREPKNPEEWVLYG